MFGNEYENDYIVRMLQQIGLMLASIIGLKKAQQFAQAQWTIEQAYQDFFDLDLQTISNSSGADLLAHLVQIGFGHADHHLVLAQLLGEEGDLHQKQNNEEEALDRFVKALEIYLQTLLGDERIDVNQHSAKIDELIAALSEVQLPGILQGALIRYYERVGRFADAEDVLFELMGDDASSVDVWTIGNRFYHRLLKKDDAELAAGNLPRSEVAEGFEEFTEQFGERALRVSRLSHCALALKAPRP